MTGKRIKVENLDANTHRYTGRTLWEDEGRD